MGRGAPRGDGQGHRGRGPQHAEGSREARHARRSGLRRYRIHVRGRLRGHALATEGTVRANDGGSGRRKTSMSKDRKSVGEGKHGSVRVDIGGRRNIKKKTQTKTKQSK